MKSQYVNELKLGQLVKEKFLLTKKNLKEKKDGGFFTQIELSDRTGTIEGVAWDNVSNELKNIPAGEFVFVTGNVGEYNERLQVVVNSISKINDSEIEAEDFLPVVEEDVTKVIAEIEETIDKVQNPFLRELLAQFITDKSFMDKFRRAPAAKKIHHAGIGGLAVHTRNVMKLVSKACETFDFLNVDLLVAGSFLHDIGKIYEYTYEKKLDQTTAGRLIGHIIFGYEMVQDRISKIKDFPEQLRLKLLHLILSHHGELEYGSPTLPCFPEALLLHFMDNLDSKLEIMRDLIRQNQGSESEWSEFHKLLGRAIYLGTDI
ncbi:MAG: HD domain-containing protein [candidate division WOR-3 bacterium]